MVLTLPEGDRRVGGADRVGMAVWLLLAYGHGDPRVQLDAIRTAGTVVVGTGGTAVLLTELLHADSDPVESSTPISSESDIAGGSGLSAPLTIKYTCTD